MKLVLASSSPRRAAILRDAGFVFDVIPVTLDESRLSNETPEDYVLRLAEAKARAVLEFHMRTPDVAQARGGESLSEYLQKLAPQLAEATKRAAATSSSLQNWAIAIGADTVVVQDRLVLGKPADAAHAREMLRLLSGRTHEVITGLAVYAWPSDRIRVELERTRVTFASLSDAEIEDYIATGEPTDKAGAYGIQGIGGRFVARVEGCYFNVMGLPVARLYHLLRELGWPDECA